MPFFSVQDDSNYYYRQLEKSICFNFEVDSYKCLNQELTTLNRRKIMMETIEGCVT